MAQCAYCKTETFLYDGGVPICLECADARDANSKPPETEHRIRTILMGALTEATARSHAASQAFNAVMGDGSVRMIHYGISYNSFRSLGIRNDNTVVGSDDQ